MSSSLQTLQREIADERRELRREIALTAATGVGLIAGVALQFAGADALGLWLAFGMAYLAGGLPAAAEATASLRRGHLDIDLLMVLAALAAAAVGEARDGAILLFLFSLAGTLESYAMGTTKRAVVGLMDLRPDTATRLVAGREERVPVETLEPGDTVLVRPGERIPADAEVAAGRSAVDQSPITGESVPVDKEPGDNVFAGTVNGHGALELRVQRLAAESTLSRMVELVTEAREQRAPSQRFSDWFGQRYTLLVLVGSAVALIVFLLSDMPRDLAFYKAATLLVVASPCAVVISVPAAVLSALAASARRGVLFKGGGALEDLASVEAIAFDKTGTLTEGRLHVVAVRPLGVSEHQALELAATVEARSEHPLARSVVEAARERGIEPREVDHATAVPGKGVRAELEGRTVWAGNRKLLVELGLALPADAETQLDAFEAQGRSGILVGDDERVLAVIAAADTPRVSARRAVAELRESGLEHIAMLTGDHQRVANQVAAELGMAAEDVHADLLPDQKVERLRELDARGPVAFVGDGVNDAAALATARVGVAMGVAGSDVALEVADVALLSDDLTKLPEAYRLARRANRVVRQNLAFALSAMVVMVLLVLFWRLPLPLGVIGHEGGTLLVVANGLRLLIPERRARRRGGPPPALEEAGQAA